MTLLTLKVVTNTTFEVLCGAPTQNSTVETVKKKKLNSVAYTSVEMCSSLQNRASLVRLDSECLRTIHVFFKHRLNWISVQTLNRPFKHKDMLWSEKPSVLASVVCLEMLSCWNVNLCLELRLLFFFYRLYLLACCIQLWAKEKQLNISIPISSGQSTRLFFTVSLNGLRSYDVNCCSHGFLWLYSNNVCCFFDS